MKGGQISLFTKRVSRQPPPLEFHLHATLADICRRWLEPRWRFTHLPFGEARDAITGARLKRMGTNPGWPDFIFVGPSAQVFWLELKRPRSGRLSEAQGDIIGHLVACGFGVLVTTSIDDAVATLKQAGILRANVEVQ